MLLKTEDGLAPLLYTFATLIKFDNITFDETQLLVAPLAIAPTPLGTMAVFFM